MSTRNAYGELLCKHGLAMTTGCNPCGRAIGDYDKDGRCIIPYTVVGLDGKVVKPAITEHDRCVRELKKLLADAEAGKVSLASWLLIYNEAMPPKAGDKMGMIQPHIRDSGMTISQTVYALQSMTYQIIAKAHE